MYALIAQLNRWSAAHPWLCVLLWALAVGLAGSGAPRMNVDASYRAFFEPHDPLLLRLNEMQAEFASGDSMVIMLGANEGDMFSAEGLELIESSTARAWELPEVIRVDSLGNFPHSRAVDDELFVDELIDDVAALSDAQRARIRAVAMQEPLLKNRLMSADGRAAIIWITFNDRTGNSLAVNQRVYHAARALRDELRVEHPGFDILITGVVAGNAAFTDVATKDASTLIPAALLCALLAMFGFLRFASGYWSSAARALGSSLAVIVVAVAIPMGLMGWLEMSANNTTAVIPVIILTLAVADSLHILLSYFDNLVAGQPSAPAMAASLKLNAEPVWLTSFTTVIGFLALNNSESPAFREMGNLVAIGVAVAWLAANTLLPAVTTLAPSRARKRLDAGRAMPKLARWLVGHYRGVLITGTLVFVGGAACIPLNTLNDAWSQYMSTGTEFGNDTHRFMNIFKDLNQIEFMLDTQQENGITDPLFLDKLSRFAQFAREQDGVRFVQSIDLTLKRLNRNMHGDDPAYEVMPQEAEEAAQYLLLYEMSLPFGASITNELNLDKSAARVVVGLEISDTAFQLAMQHMLQDWLSENAPELWHPGTSTETIMANLSMRDARSMLLGTALALLAITATLSVVFRSIGYGLLSLLVNAMPAVVALGIWGLVDGRVGISVSMVFAASLGIVVDYSVHFISKYRRAKIDRNLDAPQAIEYAFSTVGVALLVTTGVLVINFGLLGFSDFLLNVYLGVLTAMTIVLALLSQLFFLPSLLMAAARRQTVPSAVTEAT